MESNPTGHLVGAGNRPLSRRMTVSPIRAPTPAPERPCCCNRPNTVIICRMCGYIHSNARVARICPVHPRTSYLSDMKKCPKCFSQRLVEME